MSKRPHPLAAPLTKIERAKKELRELDITLKRFMATDPYGLITYCDRETREEVWATRVSDDVPDDCMVLAGNIAGNLRSAFDILAGRVKLTGRKAPVVKHYFPIFHDPDEYKTSGRGQIKGAGSLAMSLVKRLQPYHRGDDYASHPLWIIHELDILQKHNDLVLIGGAVRTQKFQIGPDTGSQKGGTVHIKMTLSSPDRVCPLIDEAPFFRFAFDTPDVNVEAQYAFYVAFDKSGVGKGEPVIPTLKQLIDFSERAIETFRPCFA